MAIPCESSLSYAGSGVVPHAMAALELVGDGSDLLSASVRVGLVFSPALRSVATSLGADVGDTRIVIPQKDAPALLERISGAVVTGDLRSEARVKGTSRPRAGWARRTSVRTSLRGHKVAFELDVRSGDVPGWDKAAMVTLHQALAMCTELARDGVGVISRNRAGVLDTALERARTAVVVTASMTTPGLVSCDGAHQRPEWLLDLVEAAEEEQEQLQDGAYSEEPTERTVIVVDQVASQSALMTACGPRGRVGLREYQDVFVERWSVCTTGMVLALAPGLGKTVCAASALREDHRLRGLVSVAVAAPRSVIDQWQRELQQWFPEAVVLGTDKLDESVQMSGPVVWLDTFDRWARRIDDIERPFDVVVVDEANVLRGSSKRASALRRLRSHSRRALALTGTPEQNGIDGLTELVRWSIDRRVVDLCEESERLAVTPAEIVGPYLYTSAGDQELEAPALEVITCIPDPDSALRLTEATARVRAAHLELQHALESNGLSRRRASAARLAALDALEQLRHLDAVSGSERWERLVELVGDARASVVFCDHLDTAELALRHLSLAGVSCATASPTTAVRFGRGELRALVVTPASQRGVNLQQADLVVHLDLPLRPGQAAQRLGRALRIGGQADLRAVCLTHQGATCHLAQKLVSGHQESMLGWVADLAALSD